MSLTKKNCILLMDFLSIFNKGTYDGSDGPKCAAQHLCITGMNKIKCSTVLYVITVSCLMVFFRCM
jgi:hypothetical protein